MAAPKPRKSKARTRQMMLVMGIGILLMAVVMLGLKVAENDKAPPPQAVSKSQPRNLSSPGSQATTGDVAGTVVDNKVASLEALLQKSIQDAKERETKAIADADAKREKEKREREDGDKQGGANAANAANANGKTAGIGANGTGPKFKLFDPARIGEGLSNAPPAPGGPMGNGSAGSGGSGNGSANGGGGAGGDSLAVDAGRGLASISFSGEDEDTSPGAAASGTGSGGGNANLTRLFKNKAVDYSNLAARSVVSGAAAFGAAPGQAVPRNTQTYLPSGTFFKVALMNGLDAPTGGQAHNNPHPILLNVIANGVMPNGFMTQMKHCFITGTGWGDLSAERAYAATENMSCIRPSGDVVDIPIRGYLVGGDGKVGLRGRVVSKQGQVLSAALLTSVLSNFGEVAKLAGTQVTPLGGAQTTSSLTSEQLLRRGAFGGVGDTAKALSQYYISLAEKLYPVIEVDGGQTAEVVLMQGVSLTQPVVPGQAQQRPGGSSMGGFSAGR